MNITDINNRLGFEVPESYASVYGAGGLTDGYDPKTLCVLNLRIKSLVKADDTKDKFFINEDGLGNYYFVWRNRDDPGVYLLAHDPEGIETTRRTLREFINEHEQQGAIVHFVASGKLAICKTAVTGESILDPITINEWKEVITKYPQVKYIGYIEMTNPFTGALTKINDPGYSEITINNETYKFNLVDGRVITSSNKQELKVLCEKLAIELGANVYTSS